MTLAVLTVLAAFLFAGCPAQDTPKPPDPNQPQTGSIRIHGNLYAASGEKSLTYPELIAIGDAFKSRARWIQVHLWEAGTGMGKAGGSVDHSRFLEFPIIDGVFDGTAKDIWPGDYEASVYIMDADKAPLFWGETAASIAAGQTTNLEVEMDFLPTYYFRFGVNGLPGDYSFGRGGAKLVTAEGTEWPGCWALGANGVDFGFSLPLDFQGGTLVATDDNGDIYQSALPLVVAELDFAGSFRFSGGLCYDYTPVDIYGELDLDITFGYEKPPVTANGQQYLTIQDAIDACETPVDITLGEGDYEGFTIPYYPNPKTISISGLGPDKSRIVDNNPNRPHVIYTAPWSYPTSQAEATANLGKSVSVAKGDWTMWLYNISIHNGPGKRNLYYSDAAVACEGGVALTMRNVVVASESNSPLEVNYASGLSVHHCVVVGPRFFLVPHVGSTRGIAAYNEDSVAVFDSVVTGCETTFHCSNGYYTVGPNCVWNYDTLATCERNPWTVDVINLVFADPLLTEDWHLDAGSPCIGTAGDGRDIGIDWLNMPG